MASGPVHPARGHSEFDHSRARRSLAAV